MGYTSAVRKCIHIEIDKRYNLIHEKEWIGEPVSIICKRYGTSRELLQVEYADRYNIPFTPSPEMVKNKITVLRGHCDTIGRRADSIENSIIMRCLIGKTQDDIQKKIEKSKIRPCKVEYFKQRVAAIVGTPELLIADLHRYIDIGISHFIMDFIGHDEESVCLFDSMVIEKV